MATIAYPAHFDESGSGKGFDVALFEVGGVSADDGIKMGETETSSLTFVQSEGIKLGDTRTISLTSIQGEGIKIGDARTMSFAQTDDTKMGDTLGNWVIIAGRSDGMKMGDTLGNWLIAVGRSDGIKIGDARTISLTSIQGEGIKIGDAKTITLSFVRTDGMKIKEPIITASVIKNRMSPGGSWIPWTQIYDLLTWVGDIWSQVADKVTTWTKRTTGSDNWSQVADKVTTWTKRTTGSGGWTK